MTVARIYISQDTSALSLGAASVLRAISDEAEARGIDLEIIATGSRGMVWLEPLIEVETSKGRIAYGPISPNEVPSLFDAGFLNGDPHHTRQGPVEDIPFFANQSRTTFACVGLIPPGDIAAYEAEGGYAGLKRALDMSCEAIVEDVTMSGLRGRGGAGFPTGIKWKTVLGTENATKYIVCNADEGDSGTFSDRMLMEGDPLCLIEGMTIAGLAVGAGEGIIYLRSEYPRARMALEGAIKNARKAGWLGEDLKNSGKTFDISIFVGAGSYVCGEETALLESLEGKRGQIRAKPPLPAISGLWGKPTVINNVVTLASVPWIMANSGDAYAALGTGRSLGTLAFQLGGNIKRGGLVEAPFGITLRELIEDFGGGTASSRPIGAVQVGGPLGAYFPESLLDTPMDYEAFITAGGMIGHGGIVVFDDTVDMAAQARFAFEFCALESCGKCTPCRIGAVRGVETLDKVINNQERTQNLALVEDLCEVMEAGSLCAMGGLTPLPVRSALQYWPQHFGGQG